MPKSKHGKKHKKKVNEYKRQIQITNKRLKEQRMKEIIEKMQSTQLKQTEEFKNSELIDNNDIDVDVDIDV